MRANDPNYQYLLVVADALADLRNELIFVGGSTAGLLLTDPMAEGIRATKDVDAIVEAATLGQYYELESRLPAHGFNGRREQRRDLPMEARRQRSAF
jgi:hypothetical protein